MDDIQEEIVAGGSGSGDAEAGVGAGGNGSVSGSERESQSQERHAPPSPAAASQRARSTTPSGSGAAANPVARSPLPPVSNPDPPVPGIHRFPTMPSQNRVRVQSPATEAPARPRGRSLSTQKADISHSTSVSGKKSNQDEDRMMAIPESRAVSPHLNRVETLSHREFRSPGLRKRTTTMKTSGSMRRNGTVTSRRRPSLNMGQTSGAAVAGDGQSINFSLAGSPVVQEVAALNQPYVDPGYTQLNPAYDQPVNTRPVWGLAKPLPRVLRPGMVPTRSELQIDTGVSDNQKPVEGDQDVDLEQGRIEQTFKLNRVTTQLQEVRRRRESNLAQSYDIISPNSPTALEQQASNRIAPFPDLTPEEEGLVADPNSYNSTQAGDQTQPDPYYPDEAASATTEKEEADEHGDWVGEEIPLKAYDPQEDEIHNLHTHWSVIRVRFREPLAELLAVTVQLTLGFCADLVITTSSSAAGNEETTDWAWGLATMVGIYIAGGISGAHLNPAISIMLWIYRGFPLRKVPSYVFAQVLGAFLAALIAYGIFREGILDFGGTDLGTGGTMGAFITYPRQTYIGATTAFFTEFTGATILAIAVLAMGDDTNAPPGAGMSAFVMGLTVTVLSMAFGYNTGLAMNPSRDFGPRLALLALGYGKSVFTMHHHYWVWGPWVAPILGAVFGGFLYDVAIFVGGESPVNYPRRRMKRAATKWRRKWGGRVRNTTRKVTRPGRGVRGGGQREMEEFVGGDKGV